MKSLLRTAPAALCTWALPGLVWAQERPYEWGWGMHPMMWGAWGLGMMLMMLLFWGLMIGGLVLAIRWLLDQRKNTRAVTALEILKRRYAEGEIEKEEFEAMRQDLS